MSACIWRCYSSLAEHGAAVLWPFLVALYALCNRRFQNWLGRVRPDWVSGPYLLDQLLHLSLTACRGSLDRCRRWLGCSSTLRHMDDLCVGIAGGYVRLVHHGRIWFDAIRHIWWGQPSALGAYSGVDCG